METNDTTMEKQSPFLKRVADLEKKVTYLQSRIDTIIKSLRR